MKFVHYSVMKEECLEGLNLSKDGIYFDGTLGGAGHSYEILKNYQGANSYIVDLKNEIFVYKNGTLTETEMI